VILTLNPKGFSVGFYSYVPLLNNNMFFQLNSDTNSSAIASIKVNATTNQVMVQYINNAKSYLYDNVSFDAILDLLTGEFESMGKFVNAYCKPCVCTTVG
jgi:hypothetical protein